MKGVGTLSLIFLGMFFASSSSHLLIADRKMSKMIQFTTDAPYCYFYTDRDLIQNTILNTEQRKVKITSDEEMSKLEAICKKKQLKSSNQGGFIYPGTKWCGPGHVANNYTDLGTHYREDACCREHDHCPLSLQRGECKQGICNKSLFTRSHCDCDSSFRRCLQNVNSETANTIGAIFFNVVQVICFRERSPCSKYQSSANELARDINDVPDYDDDQGECSLELTLGDRYESPPREGLYYWHTKGEVLETYFNRFLRKLNFL